MEVNALTKRTPRWCQENYSTTLISFQLTKNFSQLTKYLSIQCFYVVLHIYNKLSGQMIKPKTNTNVGNKFCVYILEAWRDRQATQYMWSKQGTHIIFRLEVSRLEAMGDLCTYGRIILQWSLDEEVMEVRMRIICLRRFVGGSLWTQCPAVNFTYLKVKRILHLCRCWSKDDLNQVVIAAETYLLVMIRSCVLSNTCPLLLALLFFLFWFLAFSLQCFN